MEARTLLWGISTPFIQQQQQLPQPSLSKAKYPGRRAPDQPLACWLSSIADVRRGVALGDWIPLALRRAREGERWWEWPWQRPCVTEALWLWRAQIYCRCPFEFIHVWLCIVLCSHIALVLHAIQLNCAFSYNLEFHQVHSKSWAVVFFCCCCLFVFGLFFYSF